MRENKYQVSYARSIDIQPQSCIHEFLQILSRRQDRNRMVRNFLRDCTTSGAIAQSTQGGRGTWSKGNYLQASRCWQSRRTLLGPTSAPFHHRSTIFPMNARSDGHIIEPVPGVVLYRVSKSREQPERLGGPAFVRFTIQSTE